MIDANKQLNVIDANTLNLAHAARGGQFTASSITPSTPLYAGLYEAGSPVGRDRLE